MSSGLAILSGILLLTGALFTVVGGVGILRMPDVFTRMQRPASTAHNGPGTR